MASEGAVTVVVFKLFHNVIVCGTNMSWYVQKGEHVSKIRDESMMARKRTQSKSTTIKIAQVVNDSV